MGGLIFDQLTQGLQDVLTLRQKQHALTATNLANATTPGFKAKVIDFEHALDQAMDPSRAVGRAMASPRIEEIEPDPWRTDDNSVLPERENARLRHNALMYSAVARGLSSRMGLLKYAASDGK